MLQKVRRIAKEKGISGKISYSTRPGKRFMITLPEGKTVHFGSETGQTFLDHGDEKKRTAWRARHSKIKTKGGTPAHQVKNSASYLSWKILW